MQPDAAALLWDARRATQLILDFVAGRTWQDYQADPMLRSAVERQFEIIGESLNRLSRADPLTAAGVEDLPRIVAFRNVLVHGYATIDDVLVWEVATTRTDPLIATLNRGRARNELIASESASCPQTAITSHRRETTFAQVRVASPCNQSQRAGRVRALVRHLARQRQ